MEILRQSTSVVIIIKYRNFFSYFFIPLCSTSTVLYGLHSEIIFLIIYVNFLHRLAKEKRTTLENSISFLLIPAFTLVNTTSVILLTTAMQSFAYVVCASSLALRYLGNSHGNKTIIVRSFTACTYYRCVIGFI